MTSDDLGWPRMTSDDRNQQGTTLRAHSPVACMCSLRRLAFPIGALRGDAPVATGASEALRILCHGSHAAGLGHRSRRHPAAGAHDHRDAGGARYALMTSDDL